MPRNKEYKCELRLGWRYADNAESEAARTAFRELFHATNGHEVNLASKRGRALATAARAIMRMVKMELRNGRK